jgi:hypothetical protein
MTSDHGRRPALSELWEEWRNLGRITPDGSSVLLTRSQVEKLLPASSEGAHGWQAYVQHKDDCHVWGIGLTKCTCGLTALLTPSTPEDE